MTNRRDCSFSHLLGVIAEQVDQRIERASVLDSAKRPRGIGAHFDRGITQRTNQRLDAGLSFDQTEPEPRDGARRTITRAKPADQLAPDTLGPLSPDQTH